MFGCSLADHINHHFEESGNQTIVVLNGVLFARKKIRFEFNISAILRQLLRIRKRLTSQTAHRKKDLIPQSLHSIS